MGKLNFNFKILFLLVYTQGILQTIGVSYDLLKVITESFIFVILFLNFKRLKFPTKLTFTLFVYILICLSSAIYNEEPIVKSFLYFRFHLYAYFIFILARSHNWSMKEIDSQFYFLRVLLLLQVGYAFFELFILKDPQEEVVGTIFISGGEAATILPLVGLCFLFTDYLFKPKKVKLLMVFSLLLIGFASLKRGVIFYFPVIMIVIYIQYLFFMGFSTSMSILKISLLSLGAFLLFILAVSQNDSLKGNSLLDGFSKSTKYATEYTTQKSHDGYYIGRSSSSLQVLHRTGDNGIKDLIGFGTETLMGDSGDFFYYDIDYGIVGWSKEVISVGWLGMFTYFLFYLFVIRKIKRMKVVFRNSSLSKFYIIISSFFLVFILTYFTYSPIFSQSGVVSFYFMLFSGILWSYIYTQKYSDEKS